MPNAEKRHFRRRGDVPLQAGPILSQRDLLPEGYPYYPDWGIDWEDVDRRRDEDEEYA